MRPILFQEDDGAIQAINNFKLSIIQVFNLILCSI